MSERQKRTLGKMLTFPKREAYKKAGMLAPDSVAEARKEICKPCNHKQGEGCSLLGCGCGALFYSLEKSRCLKGKWPLD